MWRGSECDEEDFKPQVGGEHFGLVGHYRSIGLDTRTCASLFVRGTWDGGLGLDWFGCCTGTVHSWRSKSRVGMQCLLREKPEAALLDKKGRGYTTLNSAMVVAYQKLQRAFVL